MPVKRLFLVFFLCVSAAVAGADQGGASHDPAADAKDLETALQRGIDDPGIPFQLQVNCVDQKGNRAMEIFAGGAAIWNRRSQVMLSAGVRSALLQDLLFQGFARFERHYGGHGQPEKTAAAARMTCRIHLDIEGLQKTSVQQAGGEQSTALAGLATLLLDEVENHKESAVTPDSLQDALEKLASGRLAPQMLKLRFVSLPADDADTEGAILRIQGGKVSRQAYSPGRAIGERGWRTLDHRQYSELLETLRETRLEDLPNNLYSQDRVDFEIQVLGHKKVVIARPFAALEADSRDAGQPRFDALVRALLQQEP